MPSPLPTPASDDLGRPPEGWRLSLHKVIFESDTSAGRLFDKVIIAAILVSVAIVIADSVTELNARYRVWFDAAEWLFTVLFTLEYLARLASVTHQLRYARSFFGIVDLLAVLPTYLALFFPAMHALIDVRILRLLRIFRIFKLTEYVAEYQVLGEALTASRRKIAVFLSAVLMIVLVIGTLMYVIEGPANGFRDIPTSIYWAVSTVTTVGFGDIVPKTDLGRFIASVMMLIGWGTLAVPTGIVTAEMTVRRHGLFASMQRKCASCGAGDHLAQAAYCQHCGDALPLSQ